jgi:hypothetical protein
VESTESTGPTDISIATPEALKLIYGIKSRYVKTHFYHAWGNPKTHPTLFSERNEAVHSQLKRNIYAFSTLLSYESYVDSCTQMFVDYLRPLAGASALT